MSALVQIVYLSTAVELFTSPEIKALMTKSEANNRKVGITGILLYKDGNFMQAIEGDPWEIDRLFIKISADPRHKAITKLIRTPIEQREFSQWAMAFRDIGTPEVRNDPAFSDFMHTGLVASEFGNQPSKAKTLLATFKQNMR